MLKQEQEIFILLKDFGLSDDEAQIYLGLLRMGGGKASEVSHFTKIDRVKAYKMLENLKNLGFITSTLSSPAIFSANDIEKTLDEVIQRKLSETEKLQSHKFHLLQLLESFKVKQTETSLPRLTVISGRSNIYYQMIKVIDEAQDELYLAASVSDLIRMFYTNIPESLEKARKRNVIIKLMTELEIMTKLDMVQRLGFNYFKIAKLPSQGRILCNSDQVLVSGYTSTSSSQQTTEDSALVTNSDEIGGSMRSLCKYMWSTGKEIRVDSNTKKSSEPKTETKTKTTTALVVDDDNDAVEMFSDYLEIKGIQVSGKAHDGKEGVELYKKLKPDVVFLDVIMPEYNGLYALKKIREINPDAKIIMLTADMTTETRKKLRELKPAGVIYKPYDVEKIIDNLV
ncbi:MAG TPA: response regulator [Nitrosopumilaceae archaeon]|nr:response regulator [Nitrosopumilaceae archaeon]